MNGRIAISLIAILLAGVSPQSAFAQAPSARHCATERALGRYPPGCPRQRAQPAPPARQALSPGAIRLRDALASVPEARWLRWDDARTPQGAAGNVVATTAPEDLLALALSGNRRAQFLQGQSYYRRTSFSAEDAAQALEWYRRAAVAGDGRAQFQLGFNARSEADARWLRQSARAGHFNSMYHLGLMLAEGRGIPGNYAEAVRWYRRAAEGGHEGAMYALGTMYALGRGVARDDGEAVRWYRQSAGRGYFEGKYGLGYMYAEGRGVRRDEAEAVRLFREAAHGGSSNARRELDRRGIRWRPEPLVAPPAAEPRRRN